MFWFISSIISSNCLADLESKLPVGSSAKIILVNCISTIDTVSSGHIYLENQDITEIKEEEILGVLTMALQEAQRCFCPPETW